jgi:hypothetical protein
MNRLNITIAVVYASPSYPARLNVVSGSTQYLTGLKNHRAPAKSA